MYVRQSFPRGLLVGFFIILSSGSTFPHCSHSFQDELNPYDMQSLLWVLLTFNDLLSRNTLLHCSHLFQDEVLPYVKQKILLKNKRMVLIHKRKNMQPFSRLIPPLKATQQIMKWEENHLYYKYDIIRIIWKFWPEDNPDNGYRLLSGYHSLPYTLVGNPHCSL